MPEQSNNVFERAGRKIDEKFSEVSPKIEADLQRVISYINDQVVPEVRREGSGALRSAAEQLRKIADHMDARRRGE